MQLDTLSFHYIVLPRHIWLLLFYHTCMVIYHIWVLIVCNIITDIRVQIPHYIALFITHVCISSSPEKPSYLGHDYDYRIINHTYISRIKLYNIFTLYMYGTYVVYICVKLKVWLPLMEKAWNDYYLNTCNLCTLNNVAICSYGKLAELHIVQLQGNLMPPRGQGVQDLRVIISRAHFVHTSTH